MVFTKGAPTVIIVHRLLLLLLTRWEQIVQLKEFHLVNKFRFPVDIFRTNLNYNFLIITYIEKMLG